MAKKKVYAVRVGKEPDIYNTWAEAEAQVKGFQGAQFKSFGNVTDAEDYMKESTTEKPKTDEAKLAKKEAYQKASDEAEIEAVVLSKEESTLVLYTDGSRKKIPDTENIVFGYGTVILDRGDVLHRFGGASDHPTFAVYENVAGETMAVVEGLKWVQRNRPDVKKLVLFYDYQGVGQWAQGSWKAKNIMSQRYVTFMQNFRTETGIEIVFTHVKGHMGNRFNEMADEEAGQAIDAFIKNLSAQLV